MQIKKNKTEQKKKQNPNTTKHNLTANAIFKLIPLGKENYSGF